MIEYREDVLIKCCNRYPRYYPGGTLPVWVECPVCRRRTVEMFDSRQEAKVAWNKKMLRIDEPRKTREGKEALLSLTEIHDMSHAEVADLLGIPANTFTKMLARIKEEFTHENDED